MILKQRYARQRRYYERTHLHSDIKARPCIICGIVIPVSRVIRKPNIKYCSPQCAKQAYREHYRGYNVASSLPSGTKGALSELRVAVDLLSKGFAVFRALSPNCPCDLAVLQNGHLYRVEVKTSFRTIAGKVLALHPKGEYDILAQVFSEEIIYTPNLPIPEP